MTDTPERAVSDLYVELHNTVQHANTEIDKLKRILAEEAAWWSAGRPPREMGETK